MLLRGYGKLGIIYYYLGYILLIHILLAIKRIYKYY